MQVNPSTSGAGGVLFQALQSVAKVLEPGEAASAAAPPVPGVERALRLPDQATLAAAESAGESGRPTARGSFVNLSV